jgi:hypothetical protein
MNLSLFRGKTLAGVAAAAAITASRAAPETPQPAGETLEDVLLDLAKWGRPRVGQYGSTHEGWHCNVEVRVTPVGVTFEAKSDFRHETPLEAALVCRQNLRDAVKAIGGAA